MSVESRLACPSNSRSFEGNTDFWTCYCDGGYYSTPNYQACVLCPAGEYHGSDYDSRKYNTWWTWEDPLLCSKCSAGRYSTAVGATGVETCQPCSAGLWSVAGSSTCEVCPVNSYSPPGSALIQCTCNAGATGEDGQNCVLCLAGKYKTSSGSAACSDCRMHSISPSGC